MSSPTPPPSTAGWRVKLYQLNDEGQWDDRGTGSIMVKHLDTFGGPGVSVTSEDGDEDLLQSRIIVEDREAYSLQGDNIITWEERRPPPEQSVDLALSFQENDGCLEIWNQIQEVQGNYSAGGGRASSGDDADGEEGGAIGPAAYPAGMGLLRHHLAFELRELPEPSLANLAAIRDQLSGCDPRHREPYAGMLLEGGAAYLRKLVDIFDDLEDLEDAENLKVMAHAMKAVVVLNEGRLLETLLADAPLFNGVVGAIEYDHELKAKATWRHFLSSEARFCEVVPMDDDPELKSKIDMAFRAALLRDAVTRPGMDDNAVASLVQYIYFAHSEILNALHVSSDYLRKVVVLCSQGAAGGPAAGKKRDAGLLFLQEMCGLAKQGSVPPQTRDGLLNYLLGETPIFEALTSALADDSLGPRERLAASEVLAAVVAFDQASSFRLFVLRVGNHPPLPPWSQQPMAGGGRSVGGSAEDDAASAEGQGAAAGGSGASGGASSDLSADSGACGGSGGSEGSGGGAPSGLGGPSCPPSRGSLLSLVLHQLAHETDTGCLLHYNEVLSKCIDTELMDPSERDSFLIVSAWALLDAPF